MAARALLTWLPEVYHSLTSPFFQTEVPENAAADCARCPMATPREGTAPKGLHFLPTTKCCTHYPELPNYLVGALLHDPDCGEGAARMRQIITKGIGVSPWGIVRPRKYELLLKNSGDSFGRAESLLCPFFSGEGGGACTIYPHWDAVCSTWFCKFDAGEEGRVFWRSLRHYLEHAQESLAQHCLLRLGFNPVEVIHTHGKNAPLGPEDLDEKPLDSGVRQRLWGDWAGREEAFYLEAYKLVKGMDADAFQRSGGTHLEAAGKQLETACAKMLDPATPARLKRNPKLETVPTDEAGYLLTAYSPLDPLEVPAYMLELVDYFDGHSTVAETVAGLHEEFGVEVSQGLIQSLYRHRILVDVEEEILPY